jgi:hypothetical protein
MTNPSLQVAFLTSLIAQDETTDPDRIYQNFY